MSTISITRKNTRVAMNEYSNYNYEGEKYESSQYNIEDSTVEQNEANEGLPCEEDDVDTFYDDGLKQ